MYPNIAHCWDIPTIIENGGNQADISQQSSIVISQIGDNEEDFCSMRLPEESDGSWFTHQRENEQDMVLCLLFCISCNIK